MSEAVQTIERKIVLLAEFTEPEIRSAVLHRQTVPFSVEPVGLHPLVTAFESLHINAKILLSLLKRSDKSLCGSSSSAPLLAGLRPPCRYRALPDFLCADCAEIFQ